MAGLYSGPMAPDRGAQPKGWWDRVLGDPRVQEKANDNPLGQNSLFYAIKEFSDRARNETQGDLDRALGVSYRNRDQSRKYADMFGQQALSDIGRTERSNMAGIDQSLIGRGLYNTTVGDSQKLRVQESAARSRQGVGEAQAGLKMQSDQHYADQIVALLSSIHRGADLGMFANLLGAQVPQQKSPKWYESLLGIGGNLGGALLGNPGLLK